MAQYFDENTEVDSNPKTVYFPFGGQEYELITDRGVFSYERIDKGTRVLLDVFEEKFDGIAPKIVVDVGCGLGFRLVDILPFVGIIGFGVMNFLFLSDS